MSVLGTPVLELEYPPLGGVGIPLCDDLPDVPDLSTPVEPEPDECDVCETPQNLPTVPGRCGDNGYGWVFAALRVMPTITFGSRIEWTLHPNLRDPGPYTFQLQAGRTGLSAADDWEAVGLPAVDTFYLLDDAQRVYGKTNWTHYRVCLSTPLETYFSPPVPADGDLVGKDRREWRVIVKTWQKLLQLDRGQDGYLLKRRLFGEPCPEDCVDFQTGEVTDPQCETCYGTGFLQGYYEPLSCVYAALGRRVSHNERDGGQARGTIDDHLRVQADMIAVPQVFENDVWVDKSTDRRWFVHKIENKIEIRGVAAVVDCEFRLAPFTDPVYKIEIADQVPQ